MLKLGDLIVGGGFEALDRGLLSLDAFLLSLQDLLGDSVLVVELQELLLLALEFTHSADVTLSIAAGRSDARFGAVAQHAADHFVLGGLEQVALVLALDGFFDRLSPEVRGGTASLSCDAAEAGEVFVASAVAACAVITEPLAANLAVHRACQVVAVLMRAVSAGAVGVEDLLNVLEGWPVDDRLVATGPLDALERYHADVVVVAKHPVDHAARQRFARPLARAARSQADLLQDVGDCGDRMVAGRRQLESQLYIWDAVAIGANGRHLASLDRFCVVEVTDPGRSHAPARGVLALQAALDLLAIATRAEGVDPGHDRVQQQSLGTVVYALKRGLQLCAVALDLAQEPESVLLLTGHPR